MWIGLLLFFTISEGIYSEGSQHYRSKLKMRHLRIYSKDQNILDKSVITRRMWIIYKLGTT